MSLSKTKLTNIETGIFKSIRHGEYSRADVALQQVDQRVQIGGGVLQIAIGQWIEKQILFGRLSTRVSAARCTR